MIVVNEATEIAVKITMIVGMVCIVALSVALIVWSVRCIIRSVVETRYAFKVRYYIEDTHRRITDYHMRIRSLEQDVCELKNRRSSEESNVQL